MDSHYILQSGIFAGNTGDGLPWAGSRHRSGLVMGAVQSGKTASMLGVTAMAIDAGIDVVVILAGTRITLWRQTYDRVLSQLAPGGNDLMVPTPGVMSIDGVTPRDLFRDLSAARARRALRNRDPIVLVVMKHGQHLRAAAEALHERVYPNLGAIDRTLQVLVLDDEADDGSILDAAVEGNLDPAQDAFKQIPRHIADLWVDRTHAGETADPRLFAAYVAYTATPQANFLQVDQNPLAPRDFVAALRTPAASGGVEVREPTYHEPLGLSSFYTGGAVFYRHTSMPDGATVTEDAIPRQDSQSDSAATRRDWVREAMRAYLIAGAIKLWREPDEPRLAGLSGRSFDNFGQAKAACPDPHTMLLHPSPGVGDHFAALAEVLEWARALSATEAISAVADGCRQLSVGVLANDIHADEAPWRRWLDHYQKSAEHVTDAFGLEKSPEVPDQNAWDEVKSLLINEVIPSVKLSVVNSDPAADDRPQFWPVQNADGSWAVPTDIFTIFVSGNVMARGLTLEGLTTTLFLRSSSDPLADTQTQMQRWFGYRGQFLELCRVFLPQRQLNLFRQYHESDEALRIQIIEAMSKTDDKAPSPLVLEGAIFRATGKIVGVSKVPLCPGPSPFVDIVNDSMGIDPNVGLVSEIFAAPSSEVVVGKLRGRVLHKQFDIVEAASLLDRLTYDSYAPDPNDPTSKRWSSLEDQLQMTKDVDQSLLPFFRPAKGVIDSPQVVSPIRCPYNIAAYLRFWKASLDRPAPGLFPTDDGERPWSSLDLAERRRVQPKFYVGLRYGSLSLGTKDDDPVQTLGFDFRFVGRSIDDGRITSTWGSRNPGDSEGAYAGDQFFDYHVHNSPLPAVPDDGPRWRPVGSPGLLLFHLIRSEAGPYSVAAVGVCLPLGGPDHFAARPRS